MVMLSGESLQILPFTWAADGSALVEHGQHPFAVPPTEAVRKPGVCCSARRVVANRFEEPIAIVSFVTDTDRH
jgi:hypothetical protein